MPEPRRFLPDDPRPTTHEERQQLKRDIRAGRVVAVPRDEYDAQAEREVAKRAAEQGPEAPDPKTEAQRAADLEELAGHVNELREKKAALEAQLVNAPAEELAKLGAEIGEYTTAILAATAALEEASKN